MELTSRKIDFSRQKSPPEIIGPVISRACASSPPLMLTLADVRGYFDGCCVYPVHQSIIQSPGCDFHRFCRILLSVCFLSGRPVKAKHRIVGRGWNYPVNVTSGSVTVCVDCFDTSFLEFLTSSSCVNLLFTWPMGLWFCFG